MDLQGGLSTCCSTWPREQQPKLKSWQLDRTLHQISASVLLWKMAEKKLQDSLPHVGIGTFAKTCDQIIAAFLSVIRFNTASIRGRDKTRKPGDNYLGPCMVQRGPKWKCSARDPKWDIISVRWPQMNWVSKNSRFPSWKGGCVWIALTCPSADASVIGKCWQCQV